MTYLELIVVLSIVGTVSAVVAFNNQKFQANVDMKNLANDIAMKVVETQKNAVNGKLPREEQKNALIEAAPEWTEAGVENWKPTYGLYFNRPNNIISFTDMNPIPNGICDGKCDSQNIEFNEAITMTKGNSIKDIKLFFEVEKEENFLVIEDVSLADLSISFVRPNSEAIIKWTGKDESFTYTISYVNILLYSPQGSTANIKVYPSGRIQIN